MFAWEKLAVQLKGISRGVAKRPREPADEEWLAAHLARYFCSADMRVELPEYPSDEVQCNTTGQCGEPCLREAFAFYRDCKRFLPGTLARRTARPRLLDFGVGWGRICRFFLREFDKANVFGVDVDGALLEECRRAFGTENFLRCQAFPPTEFADGYFDVVVGFSVFSHLSEPACDAWMREFHRIVRPGGNVALTTRGRFFFDYCESLVESTDAYRAGLATMFDSFADARAKYDAGAFVHSARGAVAGSGAREGNFYGETFIPKEYAARAWSTLFRLVGFVDEPSLGKHPVMFFERLR